MKGYALEKWESTLNLCVHAHGHDVDPIMEASCNNNYFLVIISFGIYELILNHGSYHIFYLIPFLGQVKPLVLYRSMHPSNLYFDLPSSTNPLVSRGYQPIALHLMHFWWSSAFPRHSHSTGSGLSSTENTILWIEWTLRFGTPSNLLLRSLILHRVIPSLIGYTFCAKF